MESMPGKGAASPKNSEGANLRGGGGGAQDSRFWVEGLGFWLQILRLAASCSDSGNDAGLRGLRFEKLAPA